MKKGFFRLLIIIILLNTPNFDVYAKSLNELNKEKNQIKNKVNNSKQVLEETKVEKSNILKEVEKIDAELDIILKEVEKLEIDLNSTKEILAETEKELKEAEETKERQYESLKKRARIMYQYGSDGYFEILLESKGFTDFFKRIEYVNRIMKHDQNLFKRYEETEKLISNKLEEIKIQKANIEILTQDTKAKKAKLEENISKKQQAVADLKSKESSLEQQIKDLQKEDQEITKLINQAKVKATKASNNKVYSGGTGGILAHPVPQFAGRPYNDVYGQRKSPISGKSEFHSGLDMKATYGTDIVAAESGTVIFSGNRGGYGKTVIIDHGNGMTTLYAHNSKLVVSKGESVKRGQVVAKAGSTGYSTGVHAHFEVRINGKHTNPAPYLK